MGGPIGRLFDVMKIWKERGTNVSGKGLAGGHYLQEDAGHQLGRMIARWLKSQVPAKAKR